MKNLEKNLKNIVIELILKILFISISIFIIYKFLYGFYRVSGNNMSPNIKNGDLSIVCKFDKKYEYGDVVIIEKNNQKYILRIIAKPEDIINIDRDGNIYVNGGIYEENYEVIESNVHSAVEQQINLKEDEYFVLGDNRAQSVDSRDFGAVNITDIKSKVIFLLRSQEI